jgi:hypothetical protein
MVNDHGQIARVSEYSPVTCSAWIRLAESSDESDLERPNCL